MSIIDGIWPGQREGQATAKTPGRKPESPPRFFITVSKKKAAEASERLKAQGKIVIVEPRSGGTFAVRWVDWARPRGRWRDNNHGDRRMEIRP